MSRDWQKDMEVCSSVEGEQWINNGKQLEEYDRLTETGCRYIATFDREEDAAFTAEAREALPYWLQQYAAEKERAERLHKAIEKAVSQSWGVSMLELLDIKKELTASLYPKEETKP